MRATQAIATLGGIGFLKPWSGTCASAAAIPVAYVIHVLGGFPLLLIATLIAAAVGFWVVRVEEAQNDRHDAQEIVIDELVGQWIALWPLSAGLWAMGADSWLFPWPGWVGAFVLFRIFDIWKAGPVGWADKRPGTNGVMFDDMIAGAMAAVVAAIFAAIAHGMMGV